MILVYIVIVFTDDTNIDYNCSGIIHDVKTSSSGFTFQIDTHDDSFKCFYNDKPDDLGYYLLKGSFSDDGTIFFVSVMKDADALCLYDES